MQKKSELNTTIISNVTKKECIMVKKNWDINCVDVKVGMRGISLFANY